MKFLFNIYFMSKKHLLDRKLICEWLNPVLDSGFSNGFDGESSFGDRNSQSIDRNIQNRKEGQDLIDDQPWLNNVDDEGDITIHRDREYLGAMYINGVPLTSWGATYGGNTSYQRKNVMQNWSDIATHMQTIFQNVVSNHTTDNTESEFKISDISIQRITPVDSGLGVNVYVKFKFNDEELFGKFQRWGIQGRVGCAFICEPLRNLIHPEMWIRSTGKLKNIIENWMKPKPGIYKCLAKDVIIYNEFGALDRIQKDQVIEVTRSENDRITLNLESNRWFIKTPTYFWFNYYFQHIK